MAVVEGSVGVVPLMFQPGEAKRIWVLVRYKSGTRMPPSPGAVLQWTVEGGIGEVLAGHAFSDPDVPDGTPYGVLHVAQDAGGKTGYVICETILGPVALHGESDEVAIQGVEPGDEPLDLVLAFYAQVESPPSPTG